MIRFAQHVAALFACVLLPTMPARAGDVPADNRLYMVAVSHLDTQWHWNIVHTIRDCIPATFAGTFDQLDQHPGYKFSWEGAFRYMLLREYYPDLFERLKGYVADGRWSPAGGTLEGGDVNVPSPESLFRQFLYGNGFFKKELGRGAVDVFLPDCFGFGWALPSISAHAGMKGFSTQKLEQWGAWTDLPFDLGVWKGPDGNSVVAALKAGNYSLTLDQDYSSNAKWLDAAERQFTTTGLPWAYMYFGQGDQGGALDDKSLAWLDTTLAGAGPLHATCTASDQVFRDITPQQVAGLKVYDDELVMMGHGTGAYTSEAAMKRYNRKNEALADAAERAALAATWLGVPYPDDKLRDAWIRFLVHQFHDDLTGTGSPDIYTYSWNDEEIAQNRFASALTAAVGAIASQLDTRGDGVALVVFNPLSFERTDVVDAMARFPGARPDAVHVVGPEGSEVPAQWVPSAKHAEGLDVTFVATVPPVGFAVYRVVPGAGGAPANLLKASAAGLESESLAVTLDANGDVAQVHDKASNRDLLSAPARIGLWDDFSFIWPAWEILYGNTSMDPREYVTAPAQVVVTETGPARATVEVTRTAAGSTFVQRIRLAAGDAGDRVEFDTSIDWASPATLAKAIVPTATPNPSATWDLGLGAIVRPNAEYHRFEVPGQQWADVTAVDGSHGVSVLTDCKYGWDKPDDPTLRLTLIHTPLGNTYNQDQQDFGKHRMDWALYGHASGWEGGTVRAAARLNQPLRAFQSPPHDGALGKTLVLAGVDSPGVLVKAMKKAEASDEWVVRLHETGGKVASGARLHLAAGIDSAREVNGAEDATGTLGVDGGDVALDFTPFQVRTVAIKVQPPSVGAGAGAVGSRPVTLPFDTDVVSLPDAPADGAFDATGHAYAGDLWPATLADDGVAYALGPTAAGQSNAVTCRGQSIPIAPKDGDRLYVLAASNGDRDATFMVGTAPTTVGVQAFDGFIGQWTSRWDGSQPITDAAKFLAPFSKPAPVAWYGTHRHSPAGDDPYSFTYLFRYDLAVPAGAKTLTLPDDPLVRVFAATLANDPAHGVTAAGELVDFFDPGYAPIDWSAYPAGVNPEPSPEGTADAGAEAADVVGEAAEGGGTTDAVEAAGSDPGAPPDVVEAGAGQGGSGGCAAGGVAPGGAGGAGPRAWLLAGLLAVLGRAARRGGGLWT